MCFWCAFRYYQRIRYILTAAAEKVIGADPSNHCKLRSCLFKAETAAIACPLRASQQVVHPSKGVGAVSAGLDSQSLRAFLLRPVDALCKRARQDRVPTFLSHLWFALNL